MIHHHLPQHLPPKRNHQRRALKHPAQSCKSRRQHRRDVLEPQHSAQSEEPAHERISIDDPGERAPQHDVDEPVEDGDGGDGSIGAQPEVAEKSDDGDRADDDGVQDASFDEEVGVLDGIGAGDDGRAIRGASRGRHCEVR